MKTISKEESGYFEKIQAVNLAAAKVNAMYENKLEVRGGEVNLNKASNRYWIVELRMINWKKICSLSRMGKLDPEKHYSFGVVVLVDTKTSYYKVLGESGLEGNLNIVFSKWYETERKLIVQFGNRLIAYSFSDNCRAQKKMILGSQSQLLYVSLSGNGRCLTALSSDRELSAFVLDSKVPIQKIELQSEGTVAQVKSVYPYFNDIGELLMLGMSVKLNYSFYRDHETAVTLTFFREKSSDAFMKNFAETHVPDCTDCEITFSESKENKDFSIVSIFREGEKEEVHNKYLIPITKKAK